MQRPVDRNLYAPSEAWRLARLGGNRNLTYTSALRWLRRSDAQRHRRAAYTFRDMIGLVVVARLAERGVRGREIAKAWDQDVRKGRRPFSGRVLTDGRDVLSVGSRAELEETTSVFLLNRGEQGTMPALLPVLRLEEVTYSSEDDLVESWRVRPRIIVDPAVSWGAPHLEGRRLTTADVAALRAVMDEEKLAWAYDLDPALAREAVEFEADLALAG